MSHRRSQCSLCGPAALQAILQGVGFHSEFFSPCGDALRFSTKRHQYILPSVSALLFLCCPTTILFAVASVVVDAIDAVLRRRTQAHIF